MKSFELIPMMILLPDSRVSGLSVDSLKVKTGILKIEHSS